jgi:hypothetical protein
MLGGRALPIIFIPVSLGAAYLFETRFKRDLKYIFLFFLILFAFTLIHASFSYTTTIFFLTGESYTAENFIINHYDWTKPSSILADYYVTDYFQSKLTIGAYHFTSNPAMINEVDTIFYTVGLGLNMRNFNYIIEKIINEERLDVVYNNCFSIEATKS